MGFSKVSSEDPKAKLLYLSDCEGITITDKIAYVLNVKDGLAKNQKGFYGFTLKTADCKTIYAVIFDVPKFLESGLKAQGLKNCFVKIRGYADSYKGGQSIIIDSIEKVNSVDVPGNGKMFIGEVENLDEMFSEVEQYFSNIGDNMYLPKVYKVKSYASIYSGMFGGYVKFIWKWMYLISVHDEFNDGELQKVFYHSVLAYGTYLDRLAVLPVVTTTDKIEILRSLDYDGSAESRVVADCVQAILGLGKAEHLYAKIIYDCFSQVQRIAYLNELWNALPYGGVRELKCNEYLKKY